MKLIFAFCTTLVFVCLAPVVTAASDGSARLWYQHPAAQWVEALPLGNGRLGAMVFDGIEMERFQLNEGTLWGGGPYDPTHDDALKALPEIRRRVTAGDFAGAQKLASDSFMARPLSQMPYQTLGDLLITLSLSDATHHYQRSLDLSTAVARTEFQAGKTVYTREAFVSPADQVLVIRLQARDAETGKPSHFSCSLAFVSPQRTSSRTLEGNTLVLTGVNGDANGVRGALALEARLQVSVTSGSVTADGTQLHITDADSATLVLAAATSFRSYNDVSGDPAALNRATLSAIKDRTFDSLLAAHTAEHQRLFGRVSIDLGHTEAEALPTDERIRRNALADDPALAALYFQYGRYLLLSSSRPGGQPANLQGLWCDSLTPPWGSKYTININTEMNYWPAEITNLAECAEPLYRMIDDLSHTGSVVARRHYGARGWVAHHNTDIWRAAAPIDGPFWGLWPSGGAWLCGHLWEHYEFSGDRAFLDRVYPLMQGAAQFFLDALTEEPTHHWLVTNPSISPENAHHPDVSITAGPTMDNQIIRDLFNHCIEAAQVLNRDADFRAKLAAARDRLPPNQIGAQGQLQEWLQDWDASAPEQQHRHLSHLYGFFPSNQITLRGTPDLAAAVKKSLETRGDISTGWAIAWRLNLWARQQDGDRTFRILSALLGPERTYPNLFDAHPPFQIDGNLGGAAGIAEMLVQSHAGEIELLPALPTAWATGSVRGLRVRGGYEINIEWRDHALVRADLHSLWGTKAILRYRGKTEVIVTTPGQTVTWPEPNAKAK